MFPRVFVECVLLFLVAVVKIDSQECGHSSFQNNPDSLIVKGGNASEGSWPWMVAIGTHDSSGYKYRCSGFLIDRRHVISAAHCYDIGDSESFTARIGNVNLLEEAAEYRITRLVVHPDYNAGKFYDDIAILTLDREVNSPSFNPVCLPDEKVGRVNLAGRALTVVGWAARRYPGRVQTNLKYWTGFRVLSNRQCQEIFSKNLKTSFRRQFPRGISKGMLCAGLADGGHDICPHSGSPLMVQNGNRWFAVGSTSFGMGCGRPGIPDGFANITNYLEWIRENTKD